jgi:hypothetical protein
MGEEVGTDDGFRHVKSRRNPRLKLRGSHPYVGMVVSLAALR